MEMSPRCFGSRLGSAELPVNELISRGCTLRCKLLRRSPPGSSSRLLFCTLANESLAVSFFFRMGVGMVIAIEKLAVIVTHNIIAMCVKP